MALFNFGKKKNEGKEPACACSCSCSTTEETTPIKNCCSEVKDGICCIKVLGAGCASCHTQYENAKADETAVLNSQSKPPFSFLKNWIAGGVLKSPFFRDTAVSWRYRRVSFFAT